MNERTGEPRQQLDAQRWSELAGPAAAPVANAAAPAPAPAAASGAGLLPVVPAVIAVHPADSLPAAVTPAVPADAPHPVARNLSPDR
jgi:hypothetical protein